MTDPQTVAEALNLFVSVVGRDHPELFDKGFKDVVKRLPADHEGHDIAALMCRCPNGHAATLFDVELGQIGNSETYRVQCKTCGASPLELLPWGKRHWLPAEWLDESVPKLATSPSAFLARDVSGAILLRPLEGDDATVEECILQPGDRVNFCYSYRCGRAVLNVNEDGTWYVEPPFSLEPNCIVCDDFDVVIATSVQSLVDEVRESVVCVDELIEGAYDLDGWFWSDGEEFEVVVSDDGRPMFAPVASDGGVQ